MSRNWLSLKLLFLGLVMHSPSAFSLEHWWGADLGGGYQSLSLDKVTEASKSGVFGNARLIYEWRKLGHSGDLSLSLGAQYTSQDGENYNWQQKITTSNPFLDIGYLYPLFSDFYVGAVFRNQIGPGAQYDIFELSKVQYLASVGPQAEYRFSFGGEWQWVLGASFLIGLNTSQRSIFQIPIRFGVRIPIGESEKAVEARHEPVKVAQEKTQPEAPPAPQAVEFNLDSALVNFELNKATLKPAAESFLTSVAEILVSQSDNWSELDISGHTDTTGKKVKNLDLSKRRARSVLDFFVSKGVPAEKLKSEGYGSDRLLSGVAATDPSHRRVELSFLGVKEKLRLKEPLDAAIEKARKGSL